MNIASITRFTKKTIPLTLLALCTTQAFAQTYPKWLAIGDSITQHGAKAELKWEGETRGMAASSLDKDYVHQLAALLQQKNSANAQEIKIVGRLGQLSAGTMDQMQTVIASLREWDADLVTIQLGENDSLKVIGAAGFEERYRGLVDGLLAGKKRPVIVCTGVWAPGSPLDPANPQRYLPDSAPAIKDAIIEKICREKGLRFAPIAAGASASSNSGTGQSDGVRWHPNDSGMRAYAEAIAAALFASDSAKISAQK